MPRVYHPDTATPLGRIVASVGNIAALARQLGVSTQACHRWVHRGWVPPKQALRLECLHGVPARDLIDPALREISDLLSG